MDRSELRKALDACRPGSDDLRLPEFAAVAECLEADAGARRLFDRMQRFDLQIADAAHDVPVPAGLAERIMARIEASAAATAAETAAHAAVVPATTSIERRRSRKGTWSLVALAASLLVAVSLVTFWPHGRALTVEALLNDSSTWYAQLWDNGSWIPPAVPQRDLAKFPVAAAIRAVPRRGSDVSAVVGESAVAYDLSVGGHRAVLFVIPSDDLVAGTIPPLRPPFNTGGLMIGCWQVQGMIYVLVVEGDERAYQNLLEAVAQPPLA